jgi:hypothetical protein
MGFKDAVYYIEELNCAAVVQVEEQALHIVEIFSQNEIKLDVVISAFADFIFDEVVLGFTPKQTIGFQYRDYKEEDLQLFVSSELQSGFEKKQLRINSLSHT